MNKNKIANLASLIIKHSLSLFSKNLPEHVGLALLAHSNNYSIFNSKLIQNEGLFKEARDVYELALDKTGMRWADNLPKRFNHYFLYFLLKQALELPFNNTHITECGCWLGQSSYIICNTLMKSRFSGRFYIFDSFEGMSQSSTYDLVDKSRQAMENFIAPLEQVQKNLSEFNFVEYLKSWIPERFSEVENTRFSFVNIDVDLYQPIKDSINFFFPNLIDGGIIYFREYGIAQFPGAMKAINEALEEYNPKFFTPLPSGGAFLIK